MTLFINRKTKLATNVYSDKYLPDGEWEDINGNLVKTAMKPVEPKKETVNTSSTKESK